jgi:transposase
MMGRLKSEQAQLFYQFQLEDAVPEDHLVRQIDAALDLSWLRSELAPHYSSMGRPSIDPELMIRMLVVGYVFAIRSERLICREVQVNLAYRWFCKLGIEDAIPDHSAFSRARNERFREGDVFRRVFERGVAACTQLADATQAVISDPTKTPPVDTKNDEAKVTNLTKEITTFQASATALQTSISALQTSLTITIQRTIDPGITPIDLDDDPDKWLPRKPFPIGPDGLIAKFSPFLSEKKLKDANWFDDVKLATSENNGDLNVRVYLEFSKAYPRVQRCQTCSVYPTRVPANFQFRQVAFIPVTVYQGNYKDRRAPEDHIERSLIPLPAKAIPFAQFGRAQALPLNAKVFESLKWAISFADTGQITSANFESKSIGAQITGLFSGAASGAASITTEVRNAANAPSSETQRLANENNALQAQLNNINFNQQLQALIAKGLAPSP